ncbi:MAG: extracellular solute-binding protein [Anaerolineae bacterium]|nr:extracellular solute-binding protein [Anaerolineae bacterium]MDK1080346.1 extracellular solute-binding protein [Anaerolineae bacterium]MDK1118872.1 extracellular solute-binding protein [Anaerolineae bacterium]
MIFRSLNTIFLIIFLISACTPINAEVSGSEFAETVVPKATKTPIPVSKLGVELEALNDLVIDVWHPWYGTPASLFESQVEDFNESNPWGIRVQASSLSNYTELYAQASAAVHGPNRPDVVIGLPEYAIEWRQQKAVLDLNPYVSDPLHGLSATEITDFPSVFWKQDQVGDERLGVPAQRTARFLVYNQTWAKELGFKRPPTNAEEFQEQACKANKSMLLDEDLQNDGLGGWLIDTHYITNISWLLAFGGGAQEGASFRFLRPENIKATRFIKGLAEEDCAWQSNDENPLNHFVDRSALFATASMEDLPDLARGFAKAGSRDKWTVLAFPGSERSVLVVYGASYILFQSDDPDQLAAWLFVRWLLSSENQAHWVNSAGLFPLQASTISLLADYEAGHPQWADAVKLLPQGQITPQLAEWRTVRVALGDGFNFMFRVDTPVGQVPAILAQLDAIVRDLNE